MLVGTFQGSDFLNTHETRDEVKIPDGLFKGDVSHGVVWGAPITEDYCNSVVNCWLCAPNQSVFFVVADVQDYHKIDKLAWYQSLAKEPPYNFLECINDDVDDAHAEIIFPRSDFEKNIKSTAFVGRIMDDSWFDGIEFHPALSFEAEQLNRELFALASASFYTWMNSIAPETFASLPQLSLDEQFFSLSQRILNYAFSLFYIPLDVSIAVNSFLDKNVGNSRKIPYWAYWGEYAVQNAMRFINLQNKFSIWSHKAEPILSEYDSIRCEFLDFFNKNIDVLMARFAGTVGRNDKCPCGSGQKFKKCCGRGYI